MKSPAAIIGAIVLLVGLVVLAFMWQRKLETALPVPIVCDSELTAYNAALEYAKTLTEDEAEAGSLVVGILGTGSMYPWLPKAPEGMDPRTTRVAFTVRRPGAAFEDIEDGDPVSYYADWLPPGSLGVLHQAAKFQNGGWIMSGLNNAHYESKWRVTKRNFIGIVDRVYIWPQ